MTTQELVDQIKSDVLSELSITDANQSLATAQIMTALNKIDRTATDIANTVDPQSRPYPDVRF